MIRAAKAKVMGAPTPMAGLALGIASLGWSWENMIAAHGVAQWVGAAIASVLLIVLAFKFLWHGHLLRQDLAHPVVGRWCQPLQWQPWWCRRRWVTFTQWLAMLCGCLPWAYTFCFW